METNPEIGSLASGEKVVDRVNSHLHLEAVPLLHEALGRVISAGRPFIEAEVNLGRVVGETICVVTNDHDEIVFAQRPKLLMHRQAIRERLAEILDLEIERIGLQAKTGESIGIIGREEAIAAECVVLLERKKEE